MPDVARSLQVTERTVYAWFSGKTAVPYSAYKLLGSLNRFELPGWPGWHMHSGKLWTPEGFCFEPQDGAWWSLLVRQAQSLGRCTSVLTAANVRVRLRVRSARRQRRRYEAAQASDQGL